jgi:hypothetical protein
MSVIHFPFHKYLEAQERITFLEKESLELCEHIDRLYEQLSLAYKTIDESKKSRLHKVY